MEIFKLFGSIFVNTDAADQSMQKTEGKASKVGETFKSGVKTAAKWGAAIVTAAATATTAVVGFANNAAATADTVDKMSQRLGLGREAYQELDFALSQSGVDINSFQTGMKSLLKNMDAVTEGNKTATENFEKLGVSVLNTDGTMRSQEEVLFDMITAFQNMEDSAEKSRLAQELFGKQGQEILPMLNAEAGSIEEMRQQAHELGLVLSDETIDAGVKFTDTMDQLKRAVAAMGTNLGAAVIPIILQFAQIILDNLPMIQEMIGSLAPILTQMMATLLPALMSLASEILPVIMDIVTELLPIFTQIVEAVMPVIVELLGMLLPPMLEIIKAVLPVFKSMLSALMPILQMLIDTLVPIIQLFTDLLGPIVSVIADAMAPLIEIIGELINASLNPLMDVIKIVANVFGTTLKGLFNTVSSIVGNITGIFKGIATFLKGVFSGDVRMAFQGIVDIVTNIFGGLANVVKAPINAVIDLLNGFISGINNIKIPSWVPKFGGNSINIPSIPKLYTGGLVGSGMLISTNENEPELVGQYGRNTLVMNNAQIIDAMVGAIASTMETYIARITTILAGNGAMGGDIIIPVYIGQEHFDTMVVTAKQRTDYRSGGR